MEPSEPKEIEVENVIADEMVPDIDSVDCNVAPAVVDCAEEIYSFYRKMEEHSCVSADYMSNQFDINDNMRAVLIDWIIEEHYQLELLEETLYLTINIIDRFLARQSVGREQLQLVGVTAMLLACKYEEVSVPPVEDFIFITDRICDRKQVLDMEKMIIYTLGFNLSFPTPYVFMRRFLKAANSDKEVELLSYFLVELSLVEYVVLKFRPSLLAAAAIYTALSTLRGKHQWNMIMEFYTCYTEEQLQECSKMMVEFHHSAGAGELTATFRKYRSISRFSQDLIHKVVSSPSVLCCSDINSYMDVEEYNPTDDQPSPMIKGTEIMGPFEPIDTQMEENITDKAIHDIDTVDCDNALAVAEYVQDIYSYYGQIEEHSCVPPDYMSKQSDIDKKMRGKLIYWLIWVHHKYKLRAETLHLTVNIIDRFLARQPILKKNLKLVGVTAMLLASKYEEVSKPRVRKLINTLHLDYTRREILETEMLIIKTLDFNLSLPTPYVFIRRILKAANSDKKLEKLSCFIVEQSLVEYSMLKFRPSLLAAAAVYTALSALRGRNQWNEVIEFHSRYTEEQLLECASMMDRFFKSEACSKFKICVDQWWNQELR